ncbi:MAG: DNA-directed RNA polymerase subunit omega [Acidobacteriia bacterium]|nr:DNA-directed RNA polymerase subunit omega [Terriglobia bacterium]
MMRSDLVFDALHTLRNRYMLCQLASKATRRFHRPNTRIQETMNQVLQRIGVADREQVLAEPEMVAEAQRRAA